MRYNQLIALVEKHKPEVVVEIGTWDGGRAVEMAKVNPGMEYIGFDLFERASEFSDLTEKNVKPHFSAKQVADRLSEFGMTFSLIRGDTNETFTEWADSYVDKVDMVYIDGGHSVDTILKDYQNAMKVIKDGGLIVFDDYYEDMPDIDSFGANRVLEASGRDFDVLPVKDPVRGGGFTRMAVMYP